MPDTGLSRRSFVAGAVLLLGGGALASSIVLRQAADARDWDDPAAWPGAGVPGDGEAAYVQGTVRLARSVRVAGLLVGPDGVLILHPEHDVVLTSTGSVVVEGRLVARPVGRRHEVVFEGVQEGAFLGSGEGTPTTDVGLWVQGSGVLEADGGKRRAWSRLAAPATAASDVLTLREPPDGWRVGDELVLVPTGGKHRAGAGYDTVTVRSLDGAVVRFEPPLRYSHAPVAVPGAGLLGGEVLNLTRDVVVRGTEAGRAHVIVQSTGTQTLRGVRLDRLGPASLAGAEAVAAGTAVPVVGRYGLHLHHCGTATRGLVVEGLVVTRTGNHAVVAHESHGVVFRDCIAHDTVLSQYWWDAQGVRDQTDDVGYERCVASLAHAAPGVASGTPHLARRVAGFDLLRGSGNRVVDCVAVGSNGGLESAGYVWQEDAEGVWETRGCSSHDNDEHGSFVWQNTEQHHVIESLSCFHNGGFGFVHGAYSNSYTYLRCAAYANAAGAVLRQANAARSGDTQQWQDCTLDAGRRSDHVVVNGPHEFPPSAPVVFRDCRLTGARLAALGQYDATDLRSWTEVDLVDCAIDGLDIHVRRTYPASRWRVQQGGRAVELRPAAGAQGQRGALTERTVAPFMT